MKRSRLQTVLIFDTLPLKRTARKLLQIYNFVGLARLHKITYPILESCLQNQGLYYRPHE